MVPADRQQRIRSCSGLVALHLEKGRCLFDTPEFSMCRGQHLWQGGVWCVDGDGGGVSSGPCSPFLGVPTGPLPSA